MKILILLIISFNAHGGQILWFTGDGVKSLNDCMVQRQNHVDKPIKHDYVLTCSETIVFYKAKSIDKIKTTTIRINDSLVLRCPVLLSAFYSIDDFSMLVDCQNHIIYLQTQHL